jgi:RNA polymerase sigma factor (sigma-70 family)
MNEAAILTQSDETSLSPEDRKNWKIDIAKAIDRLDKQERLVMALHYHEELTLPEIAQILDIPISKVKKIHDITLKKFLNH